jgi:hypothetical protein
LTLCSLLGGKVRTLLNEALLGLRTPGAEQHLKMEKGNDEGLELMSGDVDAELREMHAEAEG